VDARESVAGRGIGGVVGARRYRLGRADYALDFERYPSDPKDAVVLANEDAVVLADDDGVVAAFHVDERLRPGAHVAVDRLVRAGINVTIASGDTRTRVEAVAERLGVAAWKARQSPTDKLALLASLRAQGARVAVVGDGVNDAPMLAGADVAVAVGTAADAAQAASDIVITGGLDALAEARAIARQTLSILRQNRRWALCYNLATVPLAALGFVPPWLAAIGMSASSLAVVVNALRIGPVEETPVEGEAIVRQRALA
jgi:Cu2+-exporting ATPase